MIFSILKRRKQPCTVSSPQRHLRVCTAISARHQRQQFHPIKRTAKHHATTAKMAQRCLPDRTGNKWREKGRARAACGPWQRQPQKSTANGHDSGPGIEQSPLQASIDDWMKHGRGGSGSGAADTRRAAILPFLPHASGPFVLTAFRPAPLPFTPESRSDICNAMQMQWTMGWLYDGMVHRYSEAPAAAHFSEHSQLSAKGSSRRFYRS